MYSHSKCFIKAYYLSIFGTIKKIILLCNMNFDKVRKIQAFPKDLGLGLSKEEAEFPENKSSFAFWFLYAEAVGIAGNDRSIF